MCGYCRVRCVLYIVCVAKILVMYVVKVTKLHNTANTHLLLLMQVCELYHTVENPVTLEIRFWLFSIRRCTFVEGLFCILALCLYQSI